MRNSTAAPIEESRRARTVRRGQWLTWATVAYNCLEGLVTVVAGVFAGSFALIGFGVDSFIEVSASFAAIWRLHADADVDGRARAERRTQRLIGLSFLALAAYVGYEATRALLGREVPDASLPGIVVAALSLIVMPLLARAKRRVAAELTSGALRAEARQTEICMYLSAILLVGLLLNAVLGWWWADPVAALAMVPLITWEGLEGLRGRHTCDDCRPVGMDARERRVRL